MRWALSVQRELPAQWVAEAAYVGNRSSDLTRPTSADLNPVPRQYLSTSPVRDHGDHQLPDGQRHQPVPGPACRATA